MPITVVAGPPPPAWRPFQTNIAARRSLPIVDPEGALDWLSRHLADPTTVNFAVLHGPPGAGKSERAREYARRRLDRYPGGAFIIDAGEGTIALGLAEIGRQWLDTHVSGQLPVNDQGLIALRALGERGSLLILDNVRSEAAIDPWLPTHGMACHVIVTTLLDRWDGDWPSFAVRPLLRPDARSLVERIAGADAQPEAITEIVNMAGGLPVQLVPMAKSLARAARRGRPAPARVLAPETTACFDAVYRWLDAGAQLLLHAAARLNTQRIATEELRDHLLDGAAWTEAQFLNHLDTGLDLHLLEGVGILTLHQLFAQFLNDTPPPAAVGAALPAVVAAQSRRRLDIASQLIAAPARADLAAALAVYPLDLETSQSRGLDPGCADGETIGRALLEIGQFSAARPWFERAAREKEQVDTHGRVDHESLGASLHQVAYCLSRTGDFAAARDVFERAVEAAGNGDIHGRIDHESLGRSLHQVGDCLSSTGDFAAARLWYERAAREKKQGDIHGRVDHESLALSLREVAACLGDLKLNDEAEIWEARAQARGRSGS